MDILSKYHDLEIAYNTVLTKAVECDHVSIIEILLDAIPNINLNNNYLLCIASENGNFNTVKYLLESDKIDVDIHTENDYALCVSTQNGTLQVVKYLVERGANIHAEDDYPLCIACQNGDIELVTYLLDKGANVYADNHYPVRIALETKNNELLLLLLNQYENLNDNEELLLCIASETGNMTMIEYIVSETLRLKSAIPNFRVKKDLPLFACIKNGHINVLDYMLKKICNQKLSGDLVYLFKDELLYTAIENGQIPTIHYILSLQMAIGKQTLTLRNLIMKMHLDENHEYIQNIYKICASRGYLEIIKIFQTMSKTSVDADVLYNAVQNDRLEILVYFIKNNTDNSISQEYLNQSLHIACKKENIEIIKYLIDIGAYIHNCNNQAIDFLATKRKFGIILQAIVNCNCNMCEQYLCSKLNPLL